MIKFTKVSFPTSYDGAKKKGYLYFQNWMYGYRLVITSLEKSFHSMEDLSKAHTEYLQAIDAIIAAKKPKDKDALEFLHGAYSALKDHVKKTPLDKRPQF